MKSIVTIVLIFLVIQLIGLYIGTKYIDAINTQQLPPPEVIPGVSSNNPEISFFLFAYIIGVTLVMLLIIKVKKSLIRGLEAFVIFVSSLVTFSFLIPLSVQFVWIDFTSLLFSPLGSIGSLLSGILTLDIIFALILTVWKFLRPTILSQDIAAIFSGSGVGALLGLSLGIVPCIIFMMILSVYDFVSVFITKHMVSMAKAITERPTAFTIATPHEFKEAKYIPIKKSKKKVHVFQLGLGDIIIPLMFSVSILNKFTIFHSLITITGSLIALIILTVIITRKPMALPALPFICSGALAGYLISLFVL
jgi:presenilin-like A22 family membrane protease